MNSARNHRAGRQVLQFLASEFADPSCGMRSGAQNCTSLLRIFIIQSLDDLDSTLKESVGLSSTLKQISRQERVPYSTLASWVERGLIEPSHRPGKSGAAVVLGDKNVLELRNLIRLRKGGLSLQRARHLMEDLRAVGYNPLSQGVFIVLDRRKGRVLRISTNKKAVREVLGPHRGQYVMIELLPGEDEREVA